METHDAVVRILVAELIVLADSEVSEPRDYRRGCVVRHRIRYAAEKRQK